MSDESTVWYDEANGVVISTEAANTIEAARESVRRMSELLEGKPRRLLVIDLSGAPLNMPSEVRRGIMDEVRQLRVDRQAFVVPNPVLRMLAKAMAKVSTQVGSAAFFASTQEAVAWLKQED